MELPGEASIGRQAACLGLFGLERRLLREILKKIVKLHSSVGRRAAPDSSYLRAGNDLTIQED